MDKEQKKIKSNQSGAKKRKIVQRKFLKKINHCHQYYHARQVTVLTKNGQKIKKNKHNAKNTNNGEHAEVI